MNSNLPLPLQLTKQQRPHVVQCLEDAELGDRQVVTCDVSLRVSRNRGVRPGQDHPEMQRGARSRIERGSLLRPG